MILAALMMMASPDAAPPICGAVVTGSHFPTLQVKDQQHRVIETIKLKDGLLAEPLPVKACGEGVVVVRWKGQFAQIDRGLVLFDQPMTICPKGALAGTGENSGNASSNGAFDPRCPQPKAKPAGSR